MHNQEKTWPAPEHPSPPRFNNITSAMFNAYLISTLKFLFEKNDKFNKITSAIFNVYLISTLKFEKTKYFWVIQNIWKNKKSND